MSGSGSTRPFLNPDIVRCFCFAATRGSPSVKNSTRFVVLKHEEGRAFNRTATRADRFSTATRTQIQSMHFDWMFEQPNTLRTWSTACVSFQVDEETVTTPSRTISFDVPCDSLPDHRLEYLTYEGEIGGERGRVRRVLEGNYTPVIDQPDRFEAELHWSDGRHSGRALVCIYRSRRLEDVPDLEDNRPLWRLSFSTG